MARGDAAASGAAGVDDAGSRERGAAAGPEKVFSRSILVSEDETPVHGAAMGSVSIIAGGLARACQGSRACVD